LRADDYLDAKLFKELQPQVFEVKIEQCPWNTDFHNINKIYKYCLTVKQI
jgi:hypothetical protein